jgi:two-component system, NarL family, nitrate/nitrite response regulator NarL
MSRTAPKTVRILLIDDHALFRESVARLLDAEPGFEVVGDCSSSAEALRILKSREVDMILLDLDLGTERGSDLLEKLRVESFTGKILLVTAGVNQSEVPNLIRKGISGIFMKHGSPALLVQGIREAMEGRAIFEQDMLRRSLETDEQSEVRQAADKLSERERQVLSFILEGLANKQIADRLQISESAVKASLQQLFAKTGVRTRSQLVRIALEQFRNQL